MFSTYCNVPSLMLSTLHILILLLLCNISTRQAGQKLSLSCQCQTAAECRSPILYLVWSSSQVHVLLARDWTKLIFCCLLLKSQCSRGKGWWKKKDAFSGRCLFRKPATWADGGLASLKSSLSCWLDRKGFYRGNWEVSGICRWGLCLEQHIWLQ